MRGDAAGSAQSYVAFVLALWTFAGAYAAYVEAPFVAWLRRRTELPASESSSASAATALAGPPPRADGAAGAGGGDDGGEDGDAVQLLAHGRSPR